MTFPQPIRIIDSTLREGCQAPGVTFDVKQSAEIALALARLEVDQIECGHPSVSPLEMARVRHVAQLGLAPPVLAHARALKEDIEAVVESTAPWVGIFLGINEVTRRVRVGGKSIEQILDSIASSVDYARRRGLKVRYTLEDATRTDEELVLRAFRTAVDAGANRICYADTVGVGDPDIVSARVRSIKSEFPSTDLEVHFHDDRGLAIANTLAAIRARANWVSTSVNGLGERAGITDLCLLLANLYYLRSGREPRGEEVQYISVFGGSLCPYAGRPSSACDGPSCFCSHVAPARPGDSARRERLYLVETQRHRQGDIDCARQFARQPGGVVSNAKTDLGNRVEIPS